MISYPQVGAGEANADWLEKHVRVGMGRWCKGELAR